MSESLRILSLVSPGSGAGLGQVGAEAAAKIFGEDFSKEVSKLVLHASGRALAGTVTVVLGGATMAYDIYRLNGDLEPLLGKGGDAAAGHLREIAKQLEEAMGEITEPEVKEKSDKEEGGDVVRAEEAEEDCHEEDKEGTVEESWQADDKTSKQKGKEES